MSIPERYVVDGGNIFWWEGETLVGCAIFANGTPDWNDSYEIEDIAFVKREQFDLRIQIAKLVAQLEVSS
jgi:hypothetical protein